MTRLAFLATLACSMLAVAGPAWGKGEDTAAYARRVVTRHVERELANPEWGPSPFKLGATAYRIRKVTVDEKNVHVTVALRVVFEQGCDFTCYHRPARWVSRTYDIPKTVLGTRDMRLVIMDDIMDRKRVAQIERSTIYFVIAGTFRSQAAAKRHAAGLHAEETDFTVLRSSDYAGLRPGYFIVMQPYLGNAQTDDLSEARREVARLAEYGISAYIARLPPLKRPAPHRARAARPVR